MTTRNNCAGAGAGAGAGTSVLEEITSVMSNEKDDLTVAAMPSSFAATAAATATTTTTSTTGPFNATRNPQPPLQQPSYSFLHVPYASRDGTLEYSTLQKVNNANRHIFQQSMAEMLLLCKEAVRRRNNRSNRRSNCANKDNNTTTTTTTTTTATTITSNRQNKDTTSSGRKRKRSNCINSNDRDENKTNCSINDRVPNSTDCKQQHKRCHKNNNENDNKRQKLRPTTKDTLSGIHDEQQQQQQQLNDSDTKNPLPSSSSSTSSTAATTATTTTTTTPTLTAVTGSSKPLSLEYIADRLDIDDPCFGYMIRTQKCTPTSFMNENYDATTHWQEGMLQGFLTATTFTNWQKSFRWDSLNEAAYYYDDEHDDDEDEQQQVDDDINDNNTSKGTKNIEQRIRDVDGSLARELQSTVHAGNIHGEGIVWPRIAEISLLGGLGTGATLLRCLIEDLENNTKPTIMANYDYIVLQATDNSIPFYESMGFVRVGAIMIEEDLNETSDDCNNNEASCTINSNDIDSDTWNITSPVFTYEVTNTGLSFTKIATKFHVADVYDILFLNKHILGMNVRPCDKPKMHTKLLIPKNALNSGDHNNTNHDLADEPPVYVPSSEIKWHICKENDTPRTIAKMYNVSVHDIVERNKVRLPGLISSSRLKDSTRIKVSHLHIPDNLYKPYAHWSFPDSKYEDPEPSYMMVRKLQRRSHSNKVPKQKQQEQQSFFASLKCLIVENDNVAPPSLLFSPPPLKAAAATTLSTSLMDSDNYNDLIVKSSLYNKVVRLKPGAMTEGSDYKYWYVLTYIPDLEWCHLAPMIEDGTFGMDKPKAFGKTKWRLLDESYGHEVDISSKYCIAIKSRSMKKTLDADKEEWDIIDDGSDPTIATNSFHRRSIGGDSSQRGTIAIKPSTERVRKITSVSKMGTTKESSLIMESPSLLATIPGSGKITLVRIKGRLLFKQSIKQLQKSTTITSTIDEYERSSPITTTKRNRMSSTIVDMPASARKAAALRSANTFLVDCETSIENDKRNQQHVSTSTKNDTSGKKKSTKRQTNAIITQKRTNPPRRASYSASTYTVDDASFSSTGGSTYHVEYNDDNTVSDSESANSTRYEHDDDSNYDKKQIPRRRQNIKSILAASTTLSSPPRRSSRFVNPSDHDKSNLALPISTRSTTKDRSSHSESGLPKSISDPVLSKGVAVPNPLTPPLCLPKLKVVDNDSKRERMLSLRSVDLTPSIACSNDRDERLSRRHKIVDKPSPTSIQAQPRARLPKLKATLDNDKNEKVVSIRSVDLTPSVACSDRDERLSRRNSKLLQKNLSDWVVGGNNGNIKR